MTQEESIKHRDVNVLLDCLAEEAAELIQVIMKIKRFGLDSYNPFDHDKKTNFNLFHQELGDLLAVIEMLEDETDFGVDRELIQMAILEKHIKAEKFIPFW